MTLHKAGLSLSDRGIQGGMAMLRCLCVMMALASPATAQNVVELRLTFDDETRLTLAQIGERVTVNVWLYGEPSAEGRDYANDMGQVYLGTETFDIWPDDQTLQLGSSLAGAPTELVQEPMMNVNIYTSRIADENNLIDCEVIDGPFSQLVAEPQTAACSMLAK